MIGLSLAGGAVALLGFVLTGLETDKGWSEAVWNEGAWPVLAWSVTLIGLVAAGYALLNSFRSPASRHRVVIALAVEACAAAAWVALAFLAPA